MFGTLYVSMGLHSYILSVIFSVLQVSKHKASSFFIILQNFIPILQLVSFYFRIVCLFFILEETIVVELQV